MSTSNPAPDVGGTAQDGGMSTAGTVVDGGPDPQAQDPQAKSQYLPEGVESSEKKYSGGAKTENSTPGVGGTAKDGGLSTAATVADGGPETGSEGPSYRP